MTMCWVLIQRSMGGGTEDRKLLSIRAAIITWNDNIVILKIITVCQCPRVRIILLLFGDCRVNYLSTHDGYGRSGQRLSTELMPGS